MPGGVFFEESICLLSRCGTPTRYIRRNIVIFADGDDALTAAQLVLVGAVVVMNRCDDSVLRTERLACNN